MVVVVVVVVVVVTVHQVSMRVPCSNMTYCQILLERRFLSSAVVPCVFSRLEAWPTAVKVHESLLVVVIVVVVLVVFVA